MLSVANKIQQRVAVSVQRVEVQGDGKQGKESEGGNC